MKIGGNSRTFIDESAEARAALATQIEARAQWAEDGEADGSPYLALAGSLRALAAHVTDLSLHRSDAAGAEG